MATQAIITLETLRCVQESDRAGTSHSEPYIWPALAIVRGGSLEMTPTAAILSDSRNVIKSEMRRGESAAIGFPSHTLAAAFQDGETNLQLILVVGLWEDDDTPLVAVQAGYQAFLDELHAALVTNLFALSQADEAGQKAIVDTIKQQVYDKVYSAIDGHLSRWEKVKVGLGWLNLDDFMGSDFKHFPTVDPTPFTLSFKGSAGDLIITNTGPGTSTVVNPPIEYEIQGSLKVARVTVNVCQAEIDAVNAAQAALHGLQLMVQSLQNQLQHATPQQKPGIVAQINHINTVQIPPAQAALDNAQHALDACKVSHDRMPQRPGLSPSVG